MKQSFRIACSELQEQVSEEWDFSPANHIVAFQRSGWQSFISRLHVQKAWECCAFVCTCMCQAQNSDDMTNRHVLTVELLNRSFKCKSKKALTSKLHCTIGLVLTCLLLCLSSHVGWQVHSMLPTFQSCAAKKSPLFCQNQMNYTVSGETNCLSETWACIFAVRNDRTILSIWSLT